MPDPDHLSAHYVRAVLDAFLSAVQIKNVKAALAVLTDDAIVVGSGPGETAFGRENLPVFFERILSGPPDVSWEWDVIETREGGSYAWFFVEGRVRAGDEIAPYRASGVCRRDELGEWKLALWHGSTPSG